MCIRDTINRIYALRNFPRTHRQAQGTDSSCPYFSFAKSVFSHYQIRVFVSSQTDVHILKYVYSNLHTRISVPHFVGIYGYTGTINRSPTAANGLQITLLANWNNVANSPQNIHIQPRKHPTNNLQQYNIQKSKTILLFSLKCNAITPQHRNNTQQHIIYNVYTHLLYTPHHTIAIDLLTIRKLKKQLSATIKGENMAQNVKKIKKIKILQSTFCRSKEYY